MYINCGMYSCMAKDKSESTYMWGLNDFKHIIPDDVSQFIPHPVGYEYTF